MKSNWLRSMMLNVMTVSVMCLGWSQASFGGVVDTGYLIESEARDASLARVEAFLARQDVERQLLSLGVDPAVVVERIGGMSNAELIALEGQIQNQIVGSDAIAVIGVVFLVLLILELVGVTDVFTAI
ncbi:MAG: PA2779 family protein [Pseudomonadota bacterium]